MVEKIRKISIEKVNFNTEVLYLKLLSYRNYNNLKGVICTYPRFLSVLLRCFKATTSSLERFETRLFNSLTVRWAKVSSCIKSFALRPTLPIWPLNDK